MKIETFVLSGKKEDAVAMSAYMRNRYPFVGTKAPERRKQSKTLIVASKRLSLAELFQAVESLYMRDEREYQNVAIEMCEANVKRLTWFDLKAYSRFVQEKAWWDTVDAWRKVFGLYIKAHPDEKEIVFNHFYQHEDFWMRRVSINLQLMEKELTNVELLTKAIEYDLKTDEFFIQKAIGWSLRQYAKVNPVWVVAYCKQTELTPFAKKEALKQLDQ
ncbi:DNA alkylation repair protein [Vagococcus silagei]|uniref:6-O-methylguanine DNA methyltransferase n=1 Tax=Vagococcus silagei TaxID=2508885 RepID=A0A4V6RMJ6_9ENTE|nr:DNA alkylation repair protein [Vagococcus silagei]THB60729.1 6-O-methylguanine DNA methyltransferase [Vagococcus silagei]